jgi:hypothetical protein
MLKRIALCILIVGITTTAFSQKQKKTVVKEGVLYFSLTAERNGKNIVIVKDNGRSIDKDSLKMADKMAAYYKTGQKISNVKDIFYDSYFLSAIKEPTILQEMHSSSFDNSIWMSCIDSLVKKEQVVIQIREITLEDGSKIQHPKLAKENKATYKIVTNPNFPPGGWKAKANHWIDLWKDWFRLKDSSFYKLDDKTLDLFASGIVYTIKEEKKPASVQKKVIKH